MAGEGQNGSNGHRDEWYEDLDALIPRRAGRVKLLGQEYDVGHFEDLSNADAVLLSWLDVEIARAREAVKGASAHEELRDRYQASVKLESQQIRLMAPGIPEDTILGLSIRVRAALRSRVTRLAEAPSEANPPEPDAGATDSSSSSPASGSSTATATAT